MSKLEQALKNVCSSFFKENGVYTCVYNGGKLTLRERNNLLEVDIRDKKPLGELKLSTTARKDVEVFNNDVKIGDFLHLTRNPDGSVNISLGRAGFSVRSYNYYR